MGRIVMKKDAHIKNRTFYQGKRVFVTGHTGFKGAWMCAILSRLGADVTGYALEAESESLFEKIHGSEMIHHIEGDVRDFGLLKKAVETAKPEIVFHLAALAQVKDCFDDPLCAYSTNVMGTVNLLEALRSCETIKSIVVVTTDKVYENKGDGAVYSETDILGGGDPYATSKTAMEFVAKAYKESYFQKDGCKLGIATVRASNVIGGGDHVRSRLIPSILNAVAGKGKVELRNPNQTRPWQSVLDALNGYLTVGRLLYDSPSEFSECWNIGPTIDGIRTVSWVLSKIKEYYGGLEVSEAERFAVRESETLGLDITKSLERLDWEPIVSADKMVELVVDFFKSQRNGMPERSICDRQIAEYYQM